MRGGCVEDGAAPDHIMVTAGRGHLPRADGKERRREQGEGTSASPRRPTLHGRHRANCFDSRASRVNQRVAVMGASDAELSRLFRERARLLEWLRITTWQPGPTAHSPCFRPRLDGIALDVTATQKADLGARAQTRLRATLSLMRPASRLPRRMRSPLAHPNRNWTLSLRPREEAHGEAYLGRR